MQGHQLFLFLEAHNCVSNKDRLGKELKIGPQCAFALCQTVLRCLCVCIHLGWGSQDLQQLGSCGTWASWSGLCPLLPCMSVSLHEDSH